MTEARPLRDVFADLAGSDGVASSSPADLLAASGHPDMPDGLVAEAVGSYADTAPIEVAEHLSSYVMAHGPVPLPDLDDVDPASWDGAFATAPVEYGGQVDPLGLDTPEHAAGAGPTAEHLGVGDLGAGDLDAGHDFGQGAVGRDPVDANAGVHFGDGGHGQLPPHDTAFESAYAHGVGADGNQADGVDGPDDVDGDGVDGPDGVDALDLHHPALHDALHDPSGLDDATLDDGADDMDHGA